MRSTKQVGPGWATEVTGHPSTGYTACSPCVHCFQTWSGGAVLLEKGHAVVELKTDARMSADDEGLTHGGFYFGMADYAAVLAIRDPNVVLGVGLLKRNFEMTYFS